MDYWGIVREAWAITRRTRPLWWLGLISAAQIIAYTAVVVTISLPMALIPQLLIATAGPDGAVGPSDVAGSRARLVELASRWLAVYWPALVAGVVLLLAVWVVLGVFDVASQPGLITQATAVVERRSASVSAGLRDGFRLWWRTVGLLAIAVLPALLYLLAMALVMFFTVSLPLYQQRLPDPRVAMTAQLMLSPLSTLATVVSIPLGVMVQLGLRDAVLRDVTAGDALKAGWVWLKTRFAEVALAYLTIVGVTLVAVLFVGLVFGAFAAVVAVAAAFVSAAGGGSAAAFAVVGCAIGVLAFAVFLALNAGLFTFTSVVWTLFWRRLTGQDGPVSTLPTQPPVPAAE